MRGTTWWLGVSLVTVALTTGASPVRAQISSLFLDEWDIAYRFSQNSARVDAMAGIWASLEDESQEINMWDFGENPAGFILDRDAWTGDFWATASNRDRRTATIPSSGEGAEGGLQISFRSYERALGVEGTLTSATVEGGDGIDFEKHEFSGPFIRLVGNQFIGDNLVFGLGVDLISEEDKVTSPNALAIAHDTDRTNWRLGLVYFLGDKIDLGGTLLLSTNSITGESKDGLHRDIYDWDRPVTEFGLQGIYGPGSDFQVGVFARRTLLDGGEVLDVSWAREFFLNPTEGFDLELRIPIVDEELTQTTLGGRVLADVGERLQLGGGLTYRATEYDVLAHPTWSRFLSTTDEETTDLEFSAGIGFRPHSRLGLYGQIDVGDRSTDSIEFESTRTIDTSLTGFRAGVEYFWFNEVALRAGGELLTTSVDNAYQGDTTSRERERTRITGGIGWVPRGGVFVLDAAIGFVNGELTDPQTFSDDLDGWTFTLTGRSLIR